MATNRFGSFRKNVRNEEINPIDFGALVLIPWFTALIFGVMTWQVDVFGGFDFSTAIWTVAGANITVPLLVVVFGVGWVVGTNEIDGSNYESEEIAFIAFAFLAPILYVFVPAFQALVEWHDLFRIGFTLAVAFATTYISYVE